MVVEIFGLSDKGNIPDQGKMYIREEKVFSFAMLTSHQDFAVHPLTDTSFRLQ